ncbi:hypothetical protein [Bradyrhizobium retamae]|uniref:hypothetical protein n=1 Tax=Bradyrhizobium retamae TaxID=1300035 RepID=UPI0018D257B8|nr:hypothetical protein [Bradyrhizobium retamae]
MSFAANAASDVVVFSPSILPLSILSLPFLAKEDRSRLGIYQAAHASSIRPATKSTAGQEEHPLQISGTISSAWKGGITTVVAPVDLVFRPDTGRFGASV